MPSNPINPGAGVIMNGNGGAYVGGENLKQVDVPIETLLGAANGATSGALISSAVSAAVTLGQEGRRSGRIFKNITGTHLMGILAGTAAFAALGGLVRYSRAKKHNEWSEKHYAFMEHQPQAEDGYAQQVQDSRTNEAGALGVKR